MARSWSFSKEISRVPWGKPATEQLRLATSASAEVWMAAHAAVAV
jgi:hypothetical protein